MLFITFGIFTHVWFFSVPVFEYSLYCWFWCGRKGATVWFVEIDLLAYLCCFNLPLFMSLVLSENNLDIGLPWNLMLGVLPLFVFQIHFKIPTDCLFLPLFSFLFFLGLFVCFWIYASPLSLPWYSRIWRPWAFRERWELDKGCVKRVLLELNRCRGYHSSWGFLVCGSRHFTQIPQASFHPNTLAAISPGYLSRHSTRIL